jgi:hypothetical protein
MELLEIPREAPRQRVTQPIQLAGTLAGVSSGLHDAIEVAYLVYAGLGEKETTKLYPSWSRQAREIGEIPLANTLSRMGGQEAGHLGFYIEATREKRAHLKPWQNELAKRFIIHTYMPVGTHLGRGDQEHRRHFGHVALSIQGDDIEPITDDVENLARSLLDIRGELKPFVRKRYEECIEAYRAGAIA